MRFSEYILRKYQIFYDYSVVVITNEVFHANKMKNMMKVDTIRKIVMIGG